MKIISKFYLENDSLKVGTKLMISDYSLRFVECMVQCDFAFMYSQGKLRFLIKDGKLTIICPTSMAFSARKDFFLIQKYLKFCFKRKKYEKHP